MNYYNYFTEIEEHFQRKRGAQVWLSPVDWALVAAWQAAGIPLGAVLGGIDAAFEKFESGRRPDTARRRSLLYCAAAVCEAAEAAERAAVGGHAGATAPRESDGFTRERVAAHLAGGLAALRTSPQPPPPDVAATLERLLAGVREGDGPLALQEIDRVLSVLDDKLLAWLQQATPVEAMVGLRAELEREVAPYRRRLRAGQLAMLERQFMQRRLLERARLPRLSLFFMAST